jgi:glycosyltransferase involved in cell wall biosynthesis
MINKKPVILGSNIGATDIIEDGKNGFIYKFNKTSGRNLASKIEEVYKKRNNLQNLTEKAYNMAISLSWDNFAKKMFEEISK